MTDGVARISYASRAQAGIGVAFLLAAGACLAGTLVGPTIVGITNPDADTAFRIATGICSVIFLVPGLLLAFLDQEVVVDRASGVLAVGWRWLRWKRMTVYPIEPDARVVLSTREMSAGRYSQTLYPVTYAHSEGTKEVTSLSVYRFSRQRAEELAKALWLPLIDRTGCETVTRRPEDLDRSASDPRTLPEGIRWRALPKGTRMRARFEDDALDVTIPPPGFDTAAFFGLALVGFAGYLAWLFATVTLGKLEGGLEGVVVGLLFGGLIVAIGLVGVAVFAERVLRTVRIRATPRGVWRLRARDGRKAKGQPAEQVEEVLLGGEGRGVFVRTDEGELELGHTLDPDEAVWLRDAVHLTLAGRPPRRPASS